jgi:hypothetical protein
VYSFSGFVFSISSISDFDTYNGSNVSLWYSILLVLHFVLHLSMKYFAFLGRSDSEVQSGCCFALGSVDLLVGQLVVDLVHCIAVADYTMN